MKFLRHLVLAVVALAFAGMATAQAQPSFPKLTGRVVDAAHLLSPEQVAQLSQLSADVEQASSRQLVVATIPDLQGYPIEDYGYQLGRAWGIGQKQANNGILLIVAPKERKVRIEVGYGLEPIMTDGLSSTIVNDTILPKFRAGDMPGGIVAGAQAIGEQMKLPLEAAEQRAQQATQKTSQTRQRSRGGGGGFPIALVFFGIIFVSVVLPMILGSGRRSRRGPWGARSYRGDGGSALPIILWTIANEIGRESSRGGWGGGSGGGGWGGGGGGGGFSGGGGSFGGGGASGSW
ncbi:TPM domain-containing protein [Sphingomonas sp. dw_22]|uniref:TPM domain-containing protein n=1 Tax=Sphingomonas sp. dw_22 TaxID=2721175 RepID=UPI001BD6DE1F|nr:TPM domain-containing protein [Sphingomonas sp. dw_22]